MQSYSTTAKGRCLASRSGWPAEHETITDESLPMSLCIQKISYSSLETAKPGIVERKRPAAVGPLDIQSLSQVLSG